MLVLKLRNRIEIDGTISIMENEITDENTRETRVNV